MNKLQEKWAALGKKKIIFYVLAAMLLIILGSIVGSKSAHAQECTPATGDGPIAQQKSAVKKISDTAHICWTEPMFLSDCTSISDDPSYKVTGYNLFISLDAPADSGMPPIQLPPTQFCADISVDTTSGVKPGSNLYYAVSAENDYGTSFLSNQEWVKVGGPPGKLTTTVN